MRELARQKRLVLEGIERIDPNTRIAKRISGAIEKRITPGDVNLLLPRGKVDREFTVVINRHIVRAAARGAQLAARQFRELKKATLPGVEDILIDLPPDMLQGVTGWLDDTFTQDYWQANVVDNTRNMLQTTIQTGITDGLSGNELANLIAEDPSGIFSPMRSIRIARTETTGALNGGHYQVNRILEADPETGVQGREWVSILDNDTRGAHVVADGQVIKGSTRFDVGAEKASFPGDPRLSPGQRINCRCTIVSVFD